MWRGSGELRGHAAPSVGDRPLAVQNGRLSGLGGDVMRQAVGLVHFDTSDGAGLKLSIDKVPSAPKRRRASPPGPLATISQEAAS